MSYVSFATDPKAMPVVGHGVLNGYKMHSIMHTGKKVNLHYSEYYYIPYTHTLVSFNGGKAKPLTISKGKFNLQEKITGGYTKKFNPDAFFLLQEAKEFFA